MSDLTTSNSSYQTGGIDTASTLVNNVSATDAQHINGPNSAALQIEAILGIGTDLKGSTADLVARLAVEHNSDGTQKTLSVGKGGTGQTSFAAGGIPLGNGTSGLFLSAGVAEQVPFYQGTATASWTGGLVFHGPAQCGPSSTVSHGGTTTISAGQNLSGVNFYTNFTVNAGVTVTVPSGGRSVIIYATNSITINGTITGVGGGASGGGGGAGAGAAGASGTEQPGGGGGNGVDNGAAGGAVLLHGVTVGSGGSGGGGAASARSGATSLWTMMSLATLGGAGGGGGGGDGGGNSGGSGGTGGASIVLIAPSITLGGSSTLNVSGSNGTSVSGGGARGGGGGGGAGAIYLICRTLTDSGCTYTLTGGSGGGGNGAGQTGGAGATGIRQLIYYGV